MTSLSKKEEQFWNWFSKNSPRYLYFESDRDYLFQELKIQLEKIDSNLTFEFSPLLENGIRELVISADGVKSSFPTVVNLVNHSPTLNGWKIIAFRQPHREVAQISFQGLNINLSDIFFSYTKDNGQIALELHIRDFYESPEWTAISFILLDTVLGEYNAEMCLSWIKKKLLIEDDVKNLIPIIDLPKIIQNYYSAFNN